MTHDSEKSKKRINDLLEEMGVDAEKCSNACEGCEDEDKCSPDKKELINKLEDKIKGMFDPNAPLKERRDSLATQLVGTGDFTRDMLGLPTDALAIICMATMVRSGGPDIIDMYLSIFKTTLGIITKSEAVDDMVEATLKRKIEKLTEARNKFNEDN